MPRRPTHTHVEVPLKRSLGGEGAQLRAALIEGLAKYLLFVRQQVPKQFDELRAEAASQDAPARPSAKPGPTMANRRRARCVEAAEGAFASIRALCGSTEPPDMAAIVIGHSPTLPKEAYVLRFAAAPERPAPGAPLDIAAAHDSTRRLLRKLVTEVESQFEGVRRPMRTWIFLHRTDRALHEAEQGVAAARLDAEGLPLPFAPRPAFRIALNRSCHVVTIDIGLQEAFAPAFEAWPGVVAHAGRPGPPPSLGAALGVEGLPLRLAQGRADGRGPGTPAEEGTGGRALSAAVADGADDAMEIDGKPSGTAAAFAGSGELSQLPAAPEEVEATGGIWVQSAHVIAGFQSS